MDPLPKTPPNPRISRSWEDSFQALVRVFFQWGIDTARRANAMLPKDGTEPLTGPLPLLSTTVAGLAAYPAADWTGGLLFISNETGGATLAFSDGTDWRRVQDRAVVS